MTDSKTIDQTTANFFATFLGDNSLQEALDDGREFSYKPLKDITAYELSLCMILIATKLASHCSLRDEQKAYDRLPPEAQRHFIVSPLDLTND